MTLLESLHIRSVRVPAIVILLTNLLAWFHLLPVFIQLLLNSSSCVYIGCILSTKITKDKEGALQSYSKSMGEDEEVIGMDQAKRFPLVASAFLLGFYVLYKFVSKDLVNALISLQFSIATVVSTSSLVSQFVPFAEPLKKVFRTIKVHPWIKKALEIGDLQLSQSSLISTAICSIPVVLFYVTKHWVLNNIYGILFSVMALKSIHISSFKVGFFLLWALFIYDIFWVYGTDVMVTVAKNLDIPIKLMFPFINEEGIEKFSMVGLGDIVIPGIFVSLCLKFDVDKFFKHSTPSAVASITVPYFSLSFAGYALGIVETFLAMWLSGHAQPALLFLVPMCTLTVLARSLIKKQFEEAKEYTTEMIKKEEEKKGVEKDNKPPADAASAELSSESQKKTQ